MHKMSFERSATHAVAARLSPEPIDGGVTAPAGFHAAGIACGIKAAGLDLAILAADANCSAAAVFTTNLAQAAPILVSKEHLRTSHGHAKAVVVNSGCANACTGEEGDAHAREMSRIAASALSCDPASVLIASTGVIGVKLDIAKVGRGIREAARVLSRDGGAAAARAIMTTDPFPKETAIEAHANGRTFRIGGMAKGSGMIEPLMATMLGFVTTDAAVEPVLLQRALKAACDKTFNAITVDGECSTNDCVFALAGGASGVALGDEDFDLLVDALTEVCEPLAVAIVRGGEGATKLITVNVTGAESELDARRAARAIANSPLVKTAIHGGDPNWGRLIAVAGRSGSRFVLDHAAVRLGPVELFRNGVPHDDRASDAAAYLQGSDISVEVDLGTGGTGRSRMWTCDLSAEYVRINAEYRT
jgi:glutamate N-acetyltransferase/amino-acid N-acetyltransferase